MAEDDEHERNKATSGDHKGNAPRHQGGDHERKAQQWSGGSKAARFR